MPWPNDPCPKCPRAASGLPLPCLAQTTRHRRYCELVDPTSPHYRPAYVALLLAEPAPATPETDADAIRRRRTAKPRVPLGTRPKPGGG